MSAEQPSLFDATIQARFEAYHERHPEVYDMLVKFALEVKRRHRKYGIAAIFERVRWHYAVETDEDFKLNNSYRSRYARLIARREPDLAEFFETRELKSA